MDLSKLIPENDTITVEIKHPITEETLVKDDGKPMTITVYGPYSQQYKAVVYEQANKRIQKVQKNKKLSYTAEDMEAAALDLVAKTTKSWDIQFDGKLPKFSEAACRDLYEKLPWLKQQVLEAQEDFSGFLKG